MTLRRVSHFGNPIIVTSKTLREFTEKKAQAAGFSKTQVVYEPLARNTAPAVALLCKYLENQGSGQSVVGVFPADHLIENQEVFRSAIDLAIQAAQKNKVVTLGLKPHAPETGYGYIQTQKKPVDFNKKLSAFEVIGFHEKPNYETAKEFLSEGSYYWNAGIFVFPVPMMIQLFQKYQPQIWQSLQGLKNDFSNIEEVYKDLPSISIDYAIMEKLSGEELYCVPCDPGWSDVGSWDSAVEVYEKSGKKLTSAIEVNSKNNFVFPYKNKKYAFVGVDDIIAVDTGDAMLLSRRGESQDVRLVVERLKSDKSKLIDEHLFEERPWGQFEVLRDEDHFKSKVIQVNPGSQISYQSHAKREEHWIIVAGTGVVVLDEKEISVTKGSYIKIPLGAKHRIRNTGTSLLSFVEVQLGSYFGEDDIVRYQDDYNR